jgi:hypothetical protein
MRVACAVIHVMRGRSWLENLPTDSKYTICVLGKFVTSYLTGRSHSLCCIYKDSKSRLGLRKCTIPFSPAFHFISWAIKCEEEEEEEEEKEKEEREEKKSYHLLFCVGLTITDPNGKK